MTPKAKNQVSGFTYDPAGNVINDGINKYVYDLDGRICAVENILAGTATQYVYDAGGARVAKGTITTWPAAGSTCAAPTTANGFTLTNQYLLGPGGDQVTEINSTITGTMAWAHSNVWVGSHLSATYDIDSTSGLPALHFHLSDPLGTRRVQTDPFGNIESYSQSLPFGDGLSVVDTAATTADDATENHFTGKERDTESGNDYFGARYYASSMGRFMSPDPMISSDKRMFDPQQWNMYAYVRNNPFSFIDPDGWELERVIVGGQQVVVDSSIRDNAIALIRDQAAMGMHLTVSESFRTRHLQAALYATYQAGLHAQAVARANHQPVLPVLPAARPGTSAHEAGLALDFHGVRATDEPDNSSLGSWSGLFWAGPRDYVHFGLFSSADYPGGADALQTLIAQNQNQSVVHLYVADYETTTQVSAGPEATIETESQEIDVTIPEVPVSNGDETSAQ